MLIIDYSNYIYKWLNFCMLDDMKKKYSRSWSYTCQFSTSKFARNLEGAMNFWMEISDVDLVWCKYGTKILTRKSLGWGHWKKWNFQYFHEFLKEIRNSMPAVHEKHGYRRQKKVAAMALLEIIDTLSSNKSPRLIIWNTYVFIHVIVWIYFRFVF